MCSKGYVLLLNMVLLKLGTNVLKRMYEDAKFILHGKVF